MPPDTQGAERSRHRLVVVDDHPVVLAGLVQILETDADMQVVERCTSGTAALAAIAAHHPDVVLLDVQMPPPNGLAVLRELRQRGNETRVILLTASLHDHDVMQAVRLGIRGLLPKEALTDDVTKCVRVVASGGTCLDPTLVGRAMAALLTREAAMREVSSVLTPREINVVEMVARGLRNREIAQRLFVSEGTIKVHLHHIYEKLGIGNREQLVAYARDKGLT